MTQRLKILLVMFGISVLVLIVDRLSTPSNSTNNITTSSNTRVQQRTNASKERFKKTDKQSTSTNRTIQSGSFVPISKDVLSLAGWGRNPFEKRSSNPSGQSNVSKQVQKSVSGGIASLENLSIQSVYKIGNDAVVVIDGSKYREGEMFNNMYIEKIESKKITFRSGKITHVINVGS
ncbi:MAG: hypothetical protein ISR83_05335 [Candidatus Marinimicrobia bacterium]|nr:hypothetical protein [Candidatus Neomarinimicrobiota bacterium]